ncbi:hypothetical protein ACX9NE_20085, partial [Mycobacterium sp. ML4]
MLGESRIETVGQGSERCPIRRWRQREGRRGAVAQRAGGMRGPGGAAVRLITGARVHGEGSASLLVGRVHADLQISRGVGVKGQR